MPNSNRAHADLPPTSDEVATIARHQTSLLRDSLSQFRQDTAEQLHALQRELESTKTQLSQFAPLTQVITPTQVSPERIQEIAKIEAFELWVQRSPDAENQISAQTLLHRVTTKISHTIKTLKAELQQTTNERDELQAKEEDHQESILQ